jgi:hypothetical protein
VGEASDTCLSSNPDKPEKLLTATTAEITEKGSPWVNTKNLFSLCPLCSAAKYSCRFVQNLIF